MSVLELIIAGLVILGVSMVIRHLRENKPVDMNHKAPNVHNVVEQVKAGPAPVKKKVVKKKKKTTKKKKAVKK